jgi:hypothetical protein
VRNPTLLRIATVAADRPACARLLAVAPAGRSTASYTITRDATYRKERFGKLEPFTVEREHDALNKMVAEIPSTLVKLAARSSKRSLNSAIIRSARCTRQIIWSQKAENFRCQLRGVTGIRRRVRLVDETEGSKSSVISFSEIEFQRRVVIPEEFRDRKFPSYFRSPGNSCLIGISLPISRNRVDLRQAGRFYYPFASRDGYTGNTFSVNAPFEMDGLRLAPADDEWNKWLISHAVSLTMDVLREELFRLFGADAYLALRTQREGRPLPKPSWFADGLLKELKDSACWPTRSANPRRPGYHTSRLTVVPAAPILDHLLPDEDVENYLHSLLAESNQATLMALESGADRFTLNSLVRLWCAGDNSDNLQTILKPGFLAASRIRSAENPLLTKP